MKTASLVIAAVMLSSVPAFAQQAGPTTNLATVEGGDFVMDPAHTRLIFSYSHFGFSTSYGLFSEAGGKLHFDPKAPANGTLDVSVNLNGIDTTVPKLDEHLKSAAFFDVAKYPTATFKSTKVVVTGPNTGTITGALTLHGVTRPVVLDATFNGAGVNPVTKAYVLGFNAVGHVKRSDFGMAAYVPAVGDDVTLTISTEFDRKQ